jgi:8-oxo-dGTP diphosphatase
VGALFVEGEQVLLGKRIGDPGKGKRAIPSGYIEYDDDFLSAAIREVKEETGLDVEIQAVLHVEPAFPSPRFHFLTIYLLARVMGGYLAPASDLEEVAWFPLSSPLPEMAFPQEIDLINTLSSTNVVGLPVDPDFASQGC